MYHAAIVTPHTGTDDYRVDPAAIPQAVHNTLHTAREERRLHPDLASICFPLFGTGRGGLPQHECLPGIWASIEQELAFDGSWQIHLLSRTAEHLDLSGWTMVSPGTDRETYPG